ncbi:MAG TPA: 3-hydroxyacyl-CoA dehydrogenase NAD-binding domain-containing protein, partial [Sphingobacteriaceae bacterium]|nr:3-hydroxyacyl-CoA dehydrogenase NAD-binding domain-containing protein [Sphingobacteriaceae bacterium]
MKIQTIKSKPVGVVGLGLMGTSIAVSLLASGHKVIALAPIPGEKEKAYDQLIDLLKHMDKAGMLKSDTQTYLDAVT